MLAKVRSPLYLDATRRESSVKSRILKNWNYSSWKFRGITKKFAVKSRASFLALVLWGGNTHESESSKLTYSVVVAAHFLQFFFLFVPTTQKLYKPLVVKTHVSPVKISYAFALWEYLTYSHHVPHGSYFEATWKRYTVDLRRKMSVTRKTYNSFNRIYGKRETGRYFFRVIS